MVAEVIALLGKDGRCDNTGGDRGESSGDTVKSELADQRDLWRT